MENSNSGGFHGFLLLLSNCAGLVVKWSLTTSPCPISGHKAGEIKATSSSITTENGSAGGCFQNALDRGILTSWQHPGMERGLDHLGVPVVRRRVLCSPSILHCPSEGTKEPGCGPRVPVHPCVGSGQGERSTCALPFPRMGLGIWVILG